MAARMESSMPFGSWAKGDEGFFATFRSWVTKQHAQSRKLPSELGEILYGLADVPTPLMVDVAPHQYMDSLGVVGLRM